MSREKPLNRWILTLIGFVPMLLIAGMAWLGRYLLGSWERVGVGFFALLFGGVGLFILGGLAQLIGFLIWKGSTYEYVREGQGGLSGVLTRRETRKRLQKMQEESQKLQDGQLSHPEDSGHLSLSGGSR